MGAPRAGHKWGDPHARSVRSSPLAYGPLGLLNCLYSARVSQVQSNSRMKAAVDDTGRVADVREVTAAVERAAPFQVWARALWAVLDLAKLEGVSLTDLFDGVPFDDASLRCTNTIAWDDYCSVCERLEARGRGPLA